MNALPRFGRELAGDPELGRDDDCPRTHGAVLAHRAERSPRGMAAPFRGYQRLASIPKCAESPLKTQKFESQATRLDEEQAFHGERFSLKP